MSEDSPMNMYIYDKSGAVENSLRFLKESTLLEKMQSRVIWESFFAAKWQEQ
jgi:hypothetical protein